MTTRINRSTTFATFSIERVYPASPERVFSAWADPKLKTRWFAGPEEWGPDEFQSDFRIGGSETSKGGPKEGPTHLFDARYHDIVPNQRIILTYDMYLDDKRISVSLATVEFTPEGSGTKLVYTEQGAFLDCFDRPDAREGGTRELLDNLGRFLSS